MLIRIRSVWLSRSTNFVVSASLLSKPSVPRTGAAYTTIIAQVCCSKSSGVLSSGERGHFYFRKFKGRSCQVDDACWGRINTHQQIICAQEKREMSRLHRKVFCSLNSAAAKSQVWHLCLSSAGPAALFSSFAAQNLDNCSANVQSEKFCPRGFQQSVKARFDVCCF